MTSFYYADKTDEISELEQKNSNIVRKIVGEGAVLLKNDDLLPLSSAEKVALFVNEFNKNLDSKYQNYVLESIKTYICIQISKKNHKITEISEEEMKANTILFLIFGLKVLSLNSEDLSMSNQFSFQITHTL